MSDHALLDDYVVADKTIARSLIRLATEADAEVWNKFVKLHPHGTIFHLWNWQNIIQSVHKHKAYFLLAENDQGVTGILPLFHNKTILFGNSLVSSAFCPYGGPLSNSPEIELLLIQFAEDLRKDLSANNLEFRLLHSTKNEVPTQQIYVTFRKAICSDHETNMNQIPRKQRAMVRKGIANELVARLGSVDEFFELYLDNIHRHGTPGSPLAFFQAIEASFKDDCEILLVQRADGKVLSGVLSLYYKDEVLPFYAGDMLESRVLAANDFKYWAVMQRAANRGAKIFDFGRSKKGTGPYSFKKNWGFEAVQLHYQYYGLNGKAIPENNPLNPKFQLLIACWRRMPKSLVRLLGPKVVRGLG